MSARLPEAKKLDAILDLVGNSTIVDSLSMSDVPLQEIARQVAEGKLQAKPSRIFKFEEIREAHRVMEANEANGKMVVVHE